MTVFKGISRILVDGREFGPGRLTGIGRVVEGLVNALIESAISLEVMLAILDTNSLPQKLQTRKGNLRVVQLPRSFLGAERRLSNLTRHDANLFISPYPKLPLFGCHSPAANIIHDVLDLTHPAYKRRPKVLFDRFRLKKALMTANLTWYDSQWSQEETKRHFGLVGCNPRIRYPGISGRFDPAKCAEDERILSKYALDAGYILAVGNGRPHKNLGVLLKIAPQTDRRLLFVGVPSANEVYWKSRFPATKASWIPYVQEDELPAIMRAAFCLAQPSTAEGYGYPPLEAMACAVPAVVSDIPVLVETTGNHALKADPLNSRAWMDALETLENASFYCDAANKGLKWAEQLRGPQAWEGYVTDIQNLLTKGGV